MNRFNIIEEIGKGAFSVVYKVNRIEDNQIYAMKVVDMRKMSTKEKENALNECRILASINSINVISYKEAFYDEEKNTLNVVMEYADDGDLDNKIEEHKKFQTNFAEEEIWKIVIQTVHGLKALHSKRILHRDIKSANVFLTKEGKVKLGDLNVSKELKIGLLKTQTGTPYYASPEVWKDKPYDYKSDMWSLGCVIYEMCTLHPPFKGNSFEGVFEKITKGMYPPIPKIYSKELSFIISSLLQVSAVIRPSINQLINNINIYQKNGMIPAIEIEYNSLIDRNALLKTIKLPGKINDINKILPKSKYRKISK